MVSFSTDKRKETNFINSPIISKFQKIKTTPSPDSSPEIIEITNAAILTPPRLPRKQCLPDNITTIEPVRFYPEFSLTPNVTTGQKKEEAHIPSAFKTKTVYADRFIHSRPTEKERLEQQVRWNAPLEKFDSKHMTVFDALLADTLLKRPAKNLLHYKTRTELDKESPKPHQFKHVLTLSKEPLTTTEVSFVSSFYSNIVDWINNEFFAYSISRDLRVGTGAADKFSTLGLELINHDKITSVKRIHDVLAFGTVKGGVYTADVNTQTMTTIYAPLDLLNEGADINTISPISPFVFAVGFKNGSIEIYDTRLADAAISSWTTHVNEDYTDICSLALSPSGGRLASSGKDGKVQIWSLAKLNENVPLTVLEGHQGAVKGLDWHPSGDVIATGGKDGKIVLWNTHQSTILMALNTEKPVSAISWSDSQTLMTSSAKNGTTNDLTTYGVNLQRKKIYSDFQLPNAHDLRIYSMVFSRNKQKLLTLSEDRTLKTWQVNTPKKEEKKPKNVTKSMFNLTIR